MGGGAWVAILPAEAARSVAEGGADEVHAVLAHHVETAQERLRPTVSSPAAEDSEWGIKPMVLGHVRCVGIDEPFTPTELRERPAAPPAKSCDPGKGLPILMRLDRGRDRPTTALPTVTLAVAAARRHHEGVGVGGPTSCDSALGVVRQINAVRSRTLPSRSHRRRAGRHGCCGQRGHSLESLRPSIGFEGPLCEVETVGR